MYNFMFECLKNKVLEVYIFINGNKAELKNSQTLAEFVVEFNLSNKTFAIEKNLEIIPRSEYEKTVIQEGDRLEIVTLCAGG